MEGLADARVELVVGDTAPKGGLGVCHGLCVWKTENCHISCIFNLLHCIFG